MIFQKDKRANLPTALHEFTSHPPTLSLIIGIPCFKLSYPRVLKKMTNENLLSNSNAKVVNTPQTRIGARQKKGKVSFSVLPNQKKKKKKENPRSEIKISFFS